MHPKSTMLITAVCGELKPLLGKMMAANIGSTNTGSITSSTESSEERAPLLSQKRLFESLSGHHEDLSSLGQSTRTLGMFAGVFSPVALSMFSALLFLRVGFIVGNAGLLVTLLQFCIAYLILLFTVSSICAISTNGAVEGGGAYFMISRTLGPELGGAIGTLFFFANIVSSALYITGCTEGLVENFGPSGYLLDSAIPDGRWWRFLYSSVLNLCSLAVCLVGAGLFAKTSVAILGVVCICLLSTMVSFFIKAEMQVKIPDENQLVQNSSYPAYGKYTSLSAETLQDNLYPQYGRDYTVDGDFVNFAGVFGVLFSGVTGIMAGANMSGELKSPGRSIPRGTLSAVAFTFVCYSVIALLTASTCTRFFLQNDFLFMMPINVWPPFVTIGIVTATFSASLSNLIGSSRVLEALAKDGIYGSLLSFVVKGCYNGNPLVAVILSWALVEIILLIGSLNLIAQINSVLFLLSYLATNLACLGLELASAPNFRPSFKFFTWHTAFFGLVGTVVMMFLINPIYASSSVIVCLLLIIVLHLFSPVRGANWGSISQALLFHQVRKYLLLLDSRKDHVKFWRPQMLLMVANPRSACPLIDFVNDLKKGGLYILGHVKIGNFLEEDDDPTQEEFGHWLSLVDHLKIKAFVELTVARSVREGMQHLVRLSGLGAMKPNTIVFGFFDEDKPLDFFGSQESSFQTASFNVSDSQGREVYSLRDEESGKSTSAEEYVAMVGDALRLQKNVCVCRHFRHLNKQDLSRDRKLKFIDVWPVNFFHPDEDDAFDTTSHFMLQLACILQMVPQWKGFRLRVFLCMSSTAYGSHSERKLRNHLHMLRIAASIHLVYAEQLFMNNVQTGASDQYFESVNRMIRQNSENTVATFLYLPVPPHPMSAESEQQCERFLHTLTVMTDNLPPTVLVHGVSAVTSTTL